ncbi:MAG: hypothetical protein OEZ36_00440 [Spirochaetota bacterium]|nr:hypothetical protein [Spirochaetota bacterium]
MIPSLKTPVIILILMLAVTNYSLAGKTTVLAPRGVIQAVDCRHNHGDDLGDPGKWRETLHCGAETGFFISHDNRRHLILRRDSYLLENYLMKHKTVVAHILLEKHRVDATKLFWSIKEIKPASR